MTSGPSVALALGGGGARGLAHIHVIETMDELGVRPTAIAGSSIGAMMGAAMASGMSGRDIRDYAKSLLTSKAEVASRVWRAQKASITELFQGGVQLGRLNAERILREFLPERIPASFEELQIPLKVTGTDYYGHKLAVFDSGDLVSAVAASVALPAVFQPVVRDGMMLVDGGMYNPVPYDLLDGTADIVVAVDVVGVPSGASGKAPSTLEVLFGTSQLMMQSIIETKLQVSRPDILLRPPVGHIRVLDFLRMETIMLETVSVKDELKRALDKAISARISGQLADGGAA